MARVLVTWEAGAHLGHRVMVSVAALALHEAGHTVAVRAPAGAEPPHAIVQAGIDWRDGLPPLGGAPGPQALQLPWESRATTLWSLGFGDPAMLGPRLAAWRELVERERPDVAVLQAAPFAQVAAAFARVPALEFGIGFDVPPAASPFLPYRNPEAFDPAVALDLERRLLAAIAREAPRGAPAFARLTDAVCGQRRLVTSVRELDHYGGADAATRRFAGPLPSLDIATERPRWATKRPRVLAYVRAACTDIASFVDALAALGGEAVVACPDATSAHVEAARRRKVRLFAQAVSLADLLPGADLVVCHGSGLVSEALCHGVRSLLLPSHFEQFMVARRLQAAGLGLFANPAEPKHYLPAMRHALADKQMAARVAALARTERACDGARALVQAVEELA